MDTAQWPQEIVVKPIEEIVTNTCPKPPPPGAAASSVNANSLDRKPRPQKEQALNCPRCNSTNTKFCYYNNYSLTQPRYFCKTCRRYWTEGGSLRNIPVGGGSRKNKRSSSSSSSSSSSLQSQSPSPLISSSCTSTTSVVTSSSRKLPDLITPQNYAKVHDHNPHHHHGQDLNLSFPSTTIHHDFKTISELVQVPSSNNLSLSSSAPCSSSALELLSGISGNNTARGSLGAFMSMPPQVHDPGSVYTPGFVLPEFKPTLGFSLDGGIGGHGGDQGFRSTLQGVQDHSASSTGGGRLLFPFEDLKQQVPSTNHEDIDQNREQADSNGYWAGMLGGSGSW